MTALPLCNHMTVTLDVMLKFSKHIDSVEHDLLTCYKLLCKNPLVAEQSQQLKHTTMSNALNTDSYSHATFTMNQTLQLATN